MPKKDMREGDERPSDAQAEVDKLVQPLADYLVENSDKNLPLAHNAGRLLRDAAAFIVTVADLPMSRKSTTACRKRKPRQPAGAAAEDGSAVREGKISMPSLMELLARQQDQPPDESLLGSLASSNELFRYLDRQQAQQRQDRSIPGQNTAPPPSGRNLQQEYEDIMRMMQQQQNPQAAQAQRASELDIGNLRGLVEMNKQVNRKSLEDVLRRAPISTNVDDRTMGPNRPIDPNYKPQITWGEIFAKNPLLIDQMSRDLGIDMVGRKPQPQKPSMSRDLGSHSIDYTLRPR
jgi:hypothetical protein